MRTEPEEVPAAPSGQQEVGVLAEPAQAGSVGRPAGRRGGSGRRSTQARWPASTSASATAWRPGEQPLLVVGPHVASDPGDRPGARRLRGRVAVVRAGAGDERPDAGQGALGIGGPLRIAIGELHRAVEPRLAAGHRAPNGHRRTARPRWPPRRRGPHAGPSPLARPSARAPRAHGRAGLPGGPHVAQRRGQPGVVEQAHGTGLGQVDHDRAWPPRSPHRNVITQSSQAAVACSAHTSQSMSRTCSDS